MSNVNHPNHYLETSMECIDAMTVTFGREWVYHFCLCNAFKYVWRYKSKNGLEDLEKAEWYLKRASMLDMDFNNQADVLRELIEGYKKEYEIAN